jgi:restriction system protein
MKKDSGKVPTYDLLFNPVLKALKSLGGSGTIEEINQKVIENEKFPDNIAAIPHGDDTSPYAEVKYRLAWAKTYLKAYGLIENSDRGVWALTTKGSKINEV